ncbi:hypothetical protein QBC37DRAFT_371897 [Rhypophila decipiens]|uniref:HNH nuclease domain-containing protein n=1 Tax=Rhypophila decipiens TaxID=261697 RepID=A0AAN6YCE9_9PEZI|nr:hypothetical protein QBC37DRAFT_371897 [Rhypophila decipiens]
MEEDGILTASSYYFFVEAVTYDYPIVLDFHDWRFPSGGPPEAWNTAALNPKLAVTGCAISQRTSAIEQAHLCHRRESMVHCNMIPLRADLHRTFDKKQWVIVPKHGFFVSHILVAEFGGLYPDYHDCVPFLHVAGKPENFQHFLFAAFAYRIINHRKLALGSGVPVKVVQYIEDKGEWETNTLDCQQLNARYGGGGLVHTRKRPRQALKKRRAEDVMEPCNDKRQKQDDIPDASDTSSITSTSDNSEPEMPDYLRDLPGTPDNSEPEMPDYLRDLPGTPDNSEPEMPDELRDRPGTPDNSEPEIPDPWDTHDAGISDSDVSESNKDS